MGKGKCGDTRKNPRIDASTEIAPDAGVKGSCNDIGGGCKPGKNDVRKK